MKTLRGLKDKRSPKIEDPEKAAQEKLALFSDEPFIFTTDYNKYESWAAYSFNIGSVIRDDISINDLIQKKLDKNKQTKIPSYISKAHTSASKELMSQDECKEFFKSPGGQIKKRNETIFPEKKSLSLTNYVLFDKRKSNIFQQKNPGQKQTLQRNKILHFKKLLLSRRNKKNFSLTDKVAPPDQPNQKSSTKLISPASVSPKSSYYQTRQNSPSSKKLIQRESQKKKSRMYVQILMQEIGKRKQLPNFQKYQKDLGLIKQKVEKARHIESSINSTKLKLHQYYQKFI